MRYDGGMDVGGMMQGWQTSRLRRTPSWLIMQTALVTNRFVTEAYASVRATRHEYAVLSAVSEFAGATQAQLGRHCHLDRSDVAGTVTELEAAGFVTRSENPADRRQKLVAITDAGTQRLEAIAAALYVAQDELLGEMSEGDRDTLSALLAGVLERHAAGH